MDIPTLEDHKRLEEKVDMLTELLVELRTEKSTTLTSEEIMVELKCSYRSFQRKIPLLKKFGMYKDGAWRMKQTDLDKYIKALMTN